MKHASSRVTRRSLLYGSAALAGGGERLKAIASHSSVTSHELPSAYTLHFKQPASKWKNALPVGNGRLGAVVFGVPAFERIQLNEESIWDGEPNRDRNNPQAKQAIPRIRELLFTGNIAEAEALAVSDVLSIPRRMPCYQTLGDLHLDFSAAGLSPGTAVEEYRLQLDLDTAIVTTAFSHGGVDYLREVFSSAPDSVIVVRLTANKPRCISLRIMLDRPQSFAVSKQSPQQLTIFGQALPVNDNPGLSEKEHQTGVRFHAAVRLIPEGRSTRFPQPGVETVLEVQEADAVTLLLDCATSYRFPARNGKVSGVDAAVLSGDLDAMRDAVDKNLAAASRRSYEELRARHLADHRRYFRRVAFDLGEDSNASTPTDVRVQAVKAGGEDIYLLPIYFQFGRYMLISSSRAGTLAANLQGIWNESVDPPWGSKYTVNINAEMNYWFAEAANLSECHLPLFDLLAAIRRQGAQTAKELYGARGSVVHHNTDLWGDSGPIDGLGGGVWAMGANWLSLHLWTRYAFTGDRGFLEEYAYPALRENALFLLDYLVCDPKTGYLTTGPSCSPENAYQLPDGKSFNLCMGPTMDIAITRSVFARLLEAGQILAKAPIVRGDREFLRQVRGAMAQLPPYEIGHDGRLQEWPVDYADHEPGHRHISHLFGLFPEDQITVSGTPELARAARLVLDKRLAAGGGSTGWSRSWIINCLARLNDGEACYANILQLFRQSTRQNLFDVCGLKENSPFQIDGNLGAPNGVIEMLLQSQGETPLMPPQEGAPWPESARVIRLLPALPRAWPNGSFRGLRARGAFQVDLKWERGKAVQAVLQTSIAQTVKIVFPVGQGVASVKANSRLLHPQLETDGALILSCAPGSRYEITFS